jgi:tetratricopeptide (TPR) repeat protein
VNVLLAMMMVWVLAAPPAGKSPARGAAPPAGPCAARNAATPAGPSEAREAPPATPQDELELGQRHYVRGEYRQAAENFALAAARLQPALKPRARYWAGLSWLGAGETIQARAAFEDVIESGAPEVPLAQLGIALCWEAEHRPDRAEETLARMVLSDMGEAGPAALAHLAALAHARGDADRERRAHDRLVREYPASMEAAEARIEVAETPAAEHPVWVQIGAFGDPEHARALVDAARRAGLGEASIRAPGAEGSGLHLVMLGPYRSEDEARRGAAQASERLRISARIVRTP